MVEVLVKWVKMEGVGGGEVVLILTVRSSYEEGRAYFEALSSVD